jgi:hypothetical protein
VSSPAQKAVKAFQVIGAVLKGGWIKKVRANRQAVRAGRPKPYPPGAILLEVFDQGLDVADQVKPGWRDGSN